MNTNKIAVVGIPGSGKSTVSRRIAKKTGLPLFHMDTLFWKSGWTLAPEAEYVAKQKEIIRTNERWIIEGYVDRPLSDSVTNADLIVYLDYPGWLCASRYAKRFFQYRNITRPELPEDCYDRFHFNRFWMILWHRERDVLEDALTLVKDQSKIVRLKSPRELEEYLSSHI